MAEQRNWESILKGFLQQMAKTDVTELEVRQGDLRLRLRRAPRPASSPQLPRPTTAEDLPPDREGFHPVAAPLTGVFYASPNPSSKPYVSAGDWVEHDTVVGLIETMKVFNEVVADCRGRVAAIRAQQGQLVHAGDPLLLVDRQAGPDQNEVAP